MHTKKRESHHQLWNFMEGKRIPAWWNHWTTIHRTPRWREKTAVRIEGIPQLAPMAPPTCEPLGVYKGRAPELGERAGGRGIYFPLTLRQPHRGATLGHPFAGWCLSKRGAGRPFISPQLRQPDPDGVALFKSMAPHAWSMDPIYRITLPKHPLKGLLQVDFCQN